MDITDVRIVPVKDDAKLKAFVTIEIEGSLVIRDLKVISGSSGNFVAMPAKKMKDGSFRDVVYSSDARLRAYIEKRVLAEYEKVCIETETKVA